MFKQNFLIVCLVISPFYAWALGSINTYYPNTELKASEIVSLQLMAMQQNDVSNHGIEITYRFLLSLQQGEQFKDCWMRDAVIPFEILEV